MPEAPECRKYAIELAERVSNRVLQSIEVVSGRYTKKVPTGLDTFMSHLPMKVVGAGVHGKFIYWILGDELSVWSTLGMTGAWSATETKHTRVKFNLDDGTIFYNDQRNFGTLKFVRGKFQLIEKLKSMGPDMLAEDVPDDVFICSMRKKPSWQITKALMEQSLVAGVGNYIKSDSLWLARLSPHRRVEDLSDAELSNLNRSIKHVMRESFQAGGSSSDGYTSSTTDDDTKRFLVYNQDQDPDCNDVIKETTEDKRSTFWAPEVQK
jgi:formamidopyrimidine-DNA glycosylase